MKQIAFTVTKGEKSLVAKVAIEVAPKPDESSLQEDDLLVQVLAMPMNPTDVLSFVPAVANMDFKQDGEAVVQTVDLKFEDYLAESIANKLPVGSEYTGKVVAAGKNGSALIGKVVSCFGPGAAEFRVTNKNGVLVHDDGVNIKYAASALINPLTVLGMLHTARKDGHSSIIHTAAASNLGQMLVKLCKKENFPLINIVRKESQVTTLKTLGAEYVLNSSSKTFDTDLVAAIQQTKATACFDAIGGGPLTSKIIGSIEAVIRGNMTPAQKLANPPKYGSSQLKSIYVYGALDMSNISIPRSMGFAFRVQGYLVTHWLQSLSLQELGAQFQAVKENLSTVFASGFGKELSMQQFIELKNFKESIAMESGKKVLLVMTPSKI